MNQKLEIGANPSAIASYYDDDFKRPIRDFILGNDRIKAAIERSLYYTSPHCKSLLDVGCGIGISAAAFSNARPSLTITAVDISQKRIDCAERLFSGLGIRFMVSEMTTPPPGGPFDVITILDVYEHIPREIHASFHRTLAESLAPNGTVVLTFPSRFHQEDLAKNDPGTLQVVDETIILEDIINLGKDIGAEVSLFEYVSIWRVNDYVHAALTRNPSLRAKPQPYLRERSIFERARSLILRKASSLWETTLGSRSRRARFVASRLGIQLNEPPRK